MSHQVYRNTTLGRTLQDALDEIITREKLPKHCALFQRETPRHFK